MAVNPIHGAKFLRIFTVNAKLRRRVLYRQRIHEGGDRLAGLDHLGDDAHAGIDGVIKTEIAILNENMPRHFASKWRVNLLHPALHVAVASLPDFRRATAIANQPQRRFRGFDVENDGRTGVTRGDILCQIGGQEVARHLSAGTVHHTDPVPVTIKADAKVSPGFGHFGAKQLQRFRVHRVRVMVGEGAVNFREQHLVLPLQPVDKRLGHRAAGAVATIPDDGQPRCPGAAGKTVDIGWLNVLLPQHATTTPGHAGAARLAKRQYVVAKKGMTTHHHLEAVMGRRIMTSGHLNGPAGVTFMRGEIQHRGWPASDINDLGAASLQPLCQPGRKRR